MQRWTCYRKHVCSLGCCFMLLYGKCLLQVSSSLTATCGRLSSLPSKRKNGNKDAFTRIAQAYDVLTDPEKREVYDELGEVSTLQYQPSHQPSHPHSPSHAAIPTLTSTLTLTRCNTNPHTHPHPHSRPHPHPNRAHCLLLLPTTPCQPLPWRPSASVRA